jgi:hypothetical protein
MGLTYSPVERSVGCRAKAGIPGWLQYRSLPMGGPTYIALSDLEAAQLIYSPK